MKPTKVIYNRRIRTGDYEHEDYTVEAELDDDNVVEALTSLKANVQEAFSGEASSADDPGQEEEETEEDPKPAKGSKKSNKSRTTTRGGKTADDEAEEEEETEEENSEEETEESEEDGSEDSDEEEESEEEEEQEDPPPKKTKTASKGGSKGFKKKPQPYQRTNETHKDIFSLTLKKIAPKWKSSTASKTHAKNVSKKMNGKDFLDENGKVLASFEAETKKLMGKYVK